MNLLNPEIFNASRQERTIIMSDVWTQIERLEDENEKLKVEMGRCPRCKMLANLSMQFNLCQSCLIERADGKPNIHGEGVVDEPTECWCDPEMEGVNPCCPTHGDKNESEGA